MEKPTEFDQQKLAIIKDALTSPDIQLRISAANSKAFTPTPEEFERGLLDSSPVIRVVFARRHDYQPTQAQINRGLLDEDCEIRAIFTDLATSLHEQQIEHLLSDPKPHVRQHLFMNVSLQLTEGQLARGLNDSSWLVRYAVVSRKDFTPTKEQFEKLLIEQDDDVRQLFKSRQMEFQSRIDKQTLSNIFLVDQHKKTKFL